VQKKPINLEKKNKLRFRQLKIIVFLLF